MRHHLKAVFNDLPAAQHVLDSLVSAGYDPSTMCLVGPPGDAAPVAGPPPSGRSVRKYLAAWFAQALNSRGPPDAAADAVPFRHVIAVDVLSDAACAMAVAVLEASEAIYVEDWREPGLPVDGPHPMARESPGYPSGTEPGALQHRDLDSRLFGTQRSDAAYPHGTMFQESLDDPSAPPDKSGP
ncbi:hypothetical protein E4L96_22725 [Massilia arenosa]|uniref:Uncharacterized protein n=1 Tax=Zemynaea arenosa TaxID=2561931 RepID=A0A4Y9RS13_9BURK|nr:hypothetical protein [Massilia arenosa]TFW10735.1 hypothetical protein E4L96_22725 [Massilia arenosa]